MGAWEWEIVSFGILLLGKYLVDCKEGGYFVDKVCGAMKLQLQLVGHER